MLSNLMRQIKDLNKYFPQLHKTTISLGPGQDM